MADDFQCMLRVVYSAFFDLVSKDFQSVEKIVHLVQGGYIGLHLKPGYLNLERGAGYSAPLPDCSIARFYF